MRLIGNIIWFIFGGLLNSLFYFLAGLILCVTVIGIPLGLQFFKIAKLILAPFGKTVETKFQKHPIANILWMIFFGWESMLCAFFFGILFSITIIGIPFGKQWFKLGMLFLIPFGAEVK